MFMLCTAQSALNLASQGENKISPEWQQLKYIQNWLYVMTKYDSPILLLASYHIDAHSTLCNQKSLCRFIVCMWMSLYEGGDLSLLKYLSLPGIPLLCHLGLQQTHHGGAHNHDHRKYW